MKIHLNRQYQQGRKVVSLNTGDCGIRGRTTTNPDRVTCNICLLRIRTGTVGPYWRSKLADRKETTWAEHVKPRRVFEARI